MVIKLDITRKYLTAERAQQYQNINKDIAIAGLPLSTTDNPRSLSTPPVSLTGSNFTGCMEDVTVNKRNIFQATKEKSKDVSVFGVLYPKCFEDAEYYPPATLTKSSSFIILHLANSQAVDFRFKFRTFDHSGVIFHYSFGANATEQLFLELTRGKLRLSLGKDHLNLNTDVSRKSSTYADGLWHKVQINFTANDLAMQVDNQTFLNGTGIKDLLQNPKLKIGSGVLGKSSLRGCFKKIQLNGTVVGITSTMSQGVDLDKCYLNDLCFTNPCLNGGVCAQHDSLVQCDCTRTGYQGARCENISAISNHNTTALLNVSSVNIPKSSTSHPSTITSSRTFTKVLITISESIPLDSSLIPTTSTAQELSFTLPSYTEPQTKQPSQSTNPKLLGNVSQSTLLTPALTPAIKETPTTFLKKTTTATNEKILAAKSEQSVKLSSAQISVTSSISSVATRVSTLPTTMSVSPSTTPPVRETHPLFTLPTAQNPTRQIIIIEKPNTITKVGFDKNQLLVYLFLFIVLVLFVGFIVIISVKLSNLPACSCLRRLQTSDQSLANQNSIELGIHDQKDSPSGVNVRGTAKSARPTSLNDSGIDRSDSGTDSHRSSAEMPEEESGELGTRIEDDVTEGFLVLQEDPSLYTQQSFGWTVLNSSSTIRHCRTSTRDLMHTANENKPRAFRPAYYRNTDVSEVDGEDDVTKPSETRFCNPMCGYRQLVSSSDCSSLDNVSVDMEACCGEGLQGNSPSCVEMREECPVF